MTEQDGDKALTVSLTEELAELRKDASAWDGLTSLDTRAAIPAAELLSILRQRLSFDISIAEAVKALADGVDVKEPVKRVVNGVRPLLNGTLLLEREMLRRGQAASSDAEAEAQSSGGDA